MDFQSSKKRKIRHDLEVQNYNFFPHLLRLGILNDFKKKLNHSACSQVAGEIQEPKPINM